MQVHQPQDWKFGTRVTFQRQCALLRWHALAPILSQGSGETGKLGPGSLWNRSQRQGVRKINLRGLLKLVRLMCKKRAAWKCIFLSYDTSCDIGKNGRHGRNESSESNLTMHWCIPSQGGWANDSPSILPSCKTKPVGTSTLSPSWQTCPTRILLILPFFM
jgi:hypothetical protein